MSNLFLSQKCFICREENPKVRRESKVGYAPRDVINPSLMYGGLTLWRPETRLSVMPLVSKRATATDVDCNANICCHMCRQTVKFF